MHARVYVGNPRRRHCARSLAFRPRPKMVHAYFAPNRALSLFTAHREFEPARTASARNRRRSGFHILEPGLSRRARSSASIPTPPCIQNRCSFARPREHRSSASHPSEAALAARWAHRPERNVCAGKDNPERNRFAHPCRRRLRAFRVRRAIGKLGWSEAGRLAAQDYRAATLSLAPRTRQNSGSSALSTMRPTLKGWSASWTNSIRKTSGRFEFELSGNRLE